MRTSLVIFSLAVTLLVPLLAQAAEPSLEARRTELDLLLAEEWEYTLRTQPELATQVGDDRYNDKLSDFSDKAIADDLEFRGAVASPTLRIDGMTIAGE